MEVVICNVRIGAVETTAELRIVEITSFIIRYVRTANQSWN